eukprot:768679-Hanusia_phi.AAC.5
METLASPSCLREETITFSPDHPLTDGSRVVARDCQRVLTMGHQTFLLLNITDPPNVEREDVACRQEGAERNGSKRTARQSQASDSTPLIYLISCLYKMLYSETQESTVQDTCRA